MASSHHFTHSRQFQLVWRRLCDVMFRFSCLFEHTLTAVCALPKYQSCREYNAYANCLSHLNVLYNFDQPDLYRFEVRLELYGANAHLVVSPPSLSLSHTPRRHRQADDQLSLLYPPRQVSDHLAPLV